jgi:hypothetical protein
MYYIYDTTNSNLYVGTSKEQVPYATTIVPPELDRDKYSFDITNNTWIIDQTLQDALAATKLADRKISLMSKYNDRCNIILQEAFTYYTGNPYSEEQIHRYDTKYKIAKAYLAGTDDGSSLQLEADLKSTTIADLANLIVGMGDALTSAMDDMNTKIDAIRVKLNIILATDDVDTVKSILIALADMPVTATDTDIKSIFANA